MKIIPLSFVLVLAFSASAQTQIRYPYVASVKGSVVEVENKKRRPLKLRQSLREQALIEAGDKSMLRLDLSAKTSLMLFENSVLKIPYIAWENGAVEKLQLEKGRIRVNIGAGEKKQVVTALSEETYSAGDYVFTYEPAVPRIELIVLEGEARFRGLENEESVQLKKGEKAAFDGVPEAGQPVYDILLKGKKVARGKIGAVKKLSAAELEKFKKEVVLVKAMPVKQAAVAKATEKQICAKPLGELNQCAWICEKNPKKAKNCETSQGAVCVRFRCNANGEWAERTELTALDARCGLNPVVDRCDY